MHTSHPNTRPRRWKNSLPRKVVAKTLPGYFSHTVTRPDEKIADIVRWYTGDEENRQAIASANPDIDPDFLLVGNDIYIPAALLKTRKPMELKSYQTSAVEMTEKPTETRETAAAPEEGKAKKIQLFGPKQFPARWSGVSPQKMTFSPTRPAWLL